MFRKCLFGLDTQTQKREGEKMSWRQYFCNHEYSKWANLIGIPFRYCKKCRGIERDLYVWDKFLFYKCTNPEEIINHIEQGGY